VYMDPEIENRLLAAALFRFCSLPYPDCYTHAKGMTTDQRLQLAEMVCGQPGKFDIPIRELEHSTLSCEVVLDQGAYGELKRHRMMTQTVQSLTPCEGYAIPRRITAAGLERTYVEAMERAANAYSELAKFKPEVASYVIPNGYNRRVLISMNLRSAHHLIRLRTAPNAHFSIRRAAARMAEEIHKSAPVLGKLLGLQPLETWQAVEKDHFTNPIVKG
ncbi:FAD-dependent thymidylate synthase, partial [bacterium]|nr:FAD-dependent thymidylate synthase [bacterium]